MARGYYLTIEPTETGVNQVNNTSDVSVLVKATSPVSLQYGAWKYNPTTLFITCDGVQKAINVPSYDFRNSQTLVLGSTVFNAIPHNSDGTKTVGINASWNAQSNYVQDINGNTTLTAQTNFQLTDIIRQATIKTAPNFNDEQSPTITIENKAGTTLTSIQACISLDGVNPAIAYKNVPLDATSFTFNLTEEERDILRNATKTTNSRTVYFILKSVLLGNEYFSVKQVTMSIINANPVINAVNYKDINANIVSITGNNQWIVQNKSSVRIEYASPTLKKGATFTKLEISLNGIEKQSTNSSGYIDYGTIDSASSLLLSIKVTDSRGNTASTTKQVTIYEYFNPDAVVSLNRLNNYENTTYLTVDGIFASINEKNAITIKYQIKEVGGAYGNEINIQDNVQVTLNLDNQKEFVVKVKVTDLFGSIFTDEYFLSKGMFPLFIDTIKNSIGINMFPRTTDVLDVKGSISQSDREWVVPNSIFNGGGWYKAMEIPLGNFASKTFIIAIQQTHVGGTGLLHLGLRKDNVTSTPYISSFHWLTDNSLINNNYIKVGRDVDTYTLYVYITAYQQFYFTVIQEKLAGGLNVKQYTPISPAYTDTVTVPSDAVSPAIKLAPISHTHTQTQISDLGNNNIVFANNKGIKGIDTNDAAKNLIKLNDSNRLQIGDGSGVIDVVGAQVNFKNNTGAAVSLIPGDTVNDAAFNAYYNTTTLGTTAFLWYRLYARVSQYTSSDEREKKYINTLDNKYENLFHKLRPIKFKWKKSELDDNKWHLGFIAQELEQSINESGLNDMALYEHSFYKKDGEEEDRYVIAYEEFIALNTHMLQKAYEKIGELENRITELEALING